MGFKGGGQSCSSDSRSYECATNRPMTQAEISRIRERSELDRGKSEKQLLEEAMARARHTNSLMSDMDRRITSIRERSESDRGKSEKQLIAEAMARARATNARNTNARNTYSGRKGGLRKTKTKRRSTKRRSTKRRRR
jgi:hypothetical protein